MRRQKCDRERADEQHIRLFIITDDTRRSSTAISKDNASSISEGEYEQLTAIAYSG
jgi:hypothetical protein